MISIIKLQQRGRSIEYANTEQSNDEEFIEIFENKAKEAANEFKLFDKNDKILVAASGGKDSTVLLYLLKKFGYSFEAITINAHIGCYSDASLENLRRFCSKEQIKLHEISLEKEFGYKLCHIMAIMEEKGFDKTSCSICGALRRYLLNKYAGRLGFNVLATGHNLDDESEGILMALFRGDLKQTARSGPLSSSKFFIKRVKPLYFCFEDEIERYSKIKGFDVHYGWCPCSAKSSRRFYSELNIEKERKFNLAVNIINNLPKLKSYYKTKSKLKICSVCEQPCSNNMCQACSILSTINNAYIDERIKEREGILEQQHGVCESSLIKIKT